MGRNGKGWGVVMVMVMVMVMVAECRRGEQVHVLRRLYEWKREGVDKTHFQPLGNLTTEQDKDERLRRESDRVARLPGQPHSSVHFNQYAGYVTLDPSSALSFFYYFVEASSNSSTLPLLLWLNGGPGCSSLGYGAMQEIGPFRVHSDGKTLYRNRYSWNNAANVLFLESPAGVGFSYTNRTREMEEELGDRKTAADNYVFLVKWLERFPHYKGRDFFIAGESYAGHYIPQLAHTILLHNRTLINLKGIMMGNAVIDDETDVKGMYDFFESHALISEDSLIKLKKSCDFSAIEQTEDCTAASDQIDMDIYYLDIYNIYAPICPNSTLTRRPRRTTITEYDPCSDHYVHAYLNREEVQEAMHANVTKIGYEWEGCSRVIKKWKDSPSTVIPLLRELMNHHIRIWVFSGDTDGRIPVTSTKYSLKKMNLTTSTPWHPWYLGGQVGGYTQVYEGGKLTFATVRGAGHQVPSYQPKRALSLLSHFLHSTPLPDTSRY
ncbi:PREDICTED: serine carboxypeptidase-like 40 [Tarenaya hassleriana]|uniref:serine carboxypeptidase-like 40 n=1 Tax=Tarenaya hassleriana TaxID=28532 RepID=UPI00053C0F55|nr:PREDICTED: serine carboxypeptidase-like 40 [Tarenaya hassleriana]